MEQRPALKWKCKKIGLDFLGHLDLSIWREEDAEKEFMRVWEMSIRRYSGLIFTSSVIVAGGYGLMLLITPSDDQIKSVW